MSGLTPLTARAHGSTRCVMCGKRFADTPDRDIAETTGEVENRGRVDSVGQVHRGIGTHPERRRWHADCLAGFEAANEAYRQQVAADRLTMLRSICEASGLDYDQMKAKYA